MPTSSAASAENSPRVVVTGGSGFVGRAVVRALTARGTPVTVVDLQPLPDELRSGLVEHVQGDLREPAVRSAAVPDGCAGIVHLAAITSVLRSIEHPAQTHEANVAVTQELLELCRARGCGRIVLASTNAVVGDIGHARITEDLPLRPLTPYGATKAACEMLLSGYAGSYGIAAAALRFTNIYGPGMAHKDSFVPRLMRAAAAGTGVQVYGDGRQRRDFVHVDDVVRGILAAFDGDYSGTAIIGAGESFSVLELVDAVRAATGREIPLDHVPAKNGEMPAVIVEIERARHDLGYRPSTGLTDGLRTVWEDFRRTDELSEVS
ncbi:NAD-dependent epimerase/dehydratase family protein [Saccharopolyspora sp. HNM0983]|uniref:NAD-dependent epimerase/dehydratase family protein n=1 Tax=Saccharopolyspora montiporae TaxID=2781240 RepID=A0A929B6L9_9PSEU|nr:NAD-dependent epimerase/dehydratase family protein [Saccharopolyspora sp. HNM0983]